MQPQQGQGQQQPQGSALGQAMMGAQQLQGQQTQQTVPNRMPQEIANNMNGQTQTGVAPILQPTGQQQNGQPVQAQPAVLSYEQQLQNPQVQQALGQINNFLNAIGHPLAGMLGGQQQQGQDQQAPAGAQMQQQQGDQQQAPGQGSQLATPLGQQQQQQ
jgi:hypothetical protein